MSIQVFQHIKDAIRNLDPADIRRHTERPLRFFLYAESEPEYRAMEEFLVRPGLSQAKRAEVLRLIYRSSDSAIPVNGNDLEVYFDDSRGLATASSGLLTFDPANPQAMIHQVLGS